MNLLSPAFLVRAYSTWFKLKSVVEKERMELGSQRNTTYREMKRKPMSGFFAVVFALQVLLGVPVTMTWRWNPILRLLIGSIYYSYQYSLVISFLAQLSGVP